MKWFIVAALIYLAAQEECKVRLSFNMAIKVLYILESSRGIIAKGSIKLRFICRSPSIQSALSTMRDGGCGWGTTAARGSI